MGPYLVLNTSDSCWCDWLVIPSVRDPRRHYRNGEQHRWVRDSTFLDCVEARPIYETEVVYREAPVKSGSDFFVV
jgi:hypothetical protein